MVKIKKISRENYEGYVYDISMKNPKSPYFYANKILTHNSLYPHIMIQCNLYGRNNKTNEGWHGGGKWDVKGYYDDKTLSGVSKLLRKWYFYRMHYKRKGVLENNEELSYKNATEYIGRKYYVLKEENNDTKIELQTITEQKAKELEELAKSGKDSREYTIKIIINTCFSGDTEIVTETGIKNIKDCEIGEKVFSINKTTKELELKRIIDTQIFSYNGQMLNFNGQSTNLTVTPDHNMVFDDNGEVITEKANDIFYDKLKFLRHKVNNNKKSEVNIKTPKKLNINSIDMFYMIGVYLTDGSLTKTGTKYQVNITIYSYKNKHIYDKICQKLDNMSFNYNKYTDQISINSKFLYNFLKQFGTTTETKKINDWVFDYNPELLESLHDGMYDNEGTRVQYKFNTTSKSLRDSFLKLILYLGDMPSYYKNSGVWRITRKRKKVYNNKRNNSIVENTEGNVYCLTVEDNNTVLAGRKGKFQWVGQCYGILNTPYYQLVHDSVAGADCTRLGRQWTKYARKVFRDEGYKLIYTDTDSWFFEDVFNDKDRLLQTKDKVINDIKNSVPFPQPTFNADIDAEIKYMFFFRGNNTEDKDTDSEMDEDDEKNKELGYMKKNYIYVEHDNNLTIKNLGIKKKNISAISKEIFWNHLVPDIVNKGKIQFSKVEIENLMRKLLRENIELAYMRKEVGPLSQYRNSMTGIHAQIAKRYGSGIHFLIPNIRNIGVGKKVKYCSINEFKEYDMDVGDIDFTNFWKELNYFIKEDKQPSLFNFGGENNE